MDSGELNIGAADIGQPTSATPNPALSQVFTERFDSERNALDQELLALIIRRQSTFIREATARVQAGIPVEMAVQAHRLSLESSINSAIKKGLDPLFAEKLFAALLSDGLAAYSHHAATLLARPESTRVLIKTARQRGIPPEVSTQLFSTLYQDESVIADEREAHDLKSIVALVQSGAVENGFVSCAIDHFEDLAQLVETLTRAELKIVGRLPIHPAHDADRSVPLVFALSKSIPSISDTSHWWTWIFLKVPEGRSLRSTDLLIKALLTARNHHVDTSHIHSLPGLSYEGFSYIEADRGSDISSRCPPSGSRSFLIDSRRGPGPQQLDRLISELIALGCFAQIVCCIPVADRPGAMHDKESPIQRLVTTLRSA